MENKGVRYTRGLVKPAIQSKLEEFQLMGYGDIKEKDLWDFLENKKWKKDTEEKQLHQLVNDILTLKIGEVMNFMTIQYYKSSQNQSREFMDNWEDILK